MNDDAEARMQDPKGHYSHDEKVGLVVLAVIVAVVIVAVVIF